MSKPSKSSATGAPVVAPESDKTTLAHRFNHEGAGNAGMTMVIAFPRDAP
jgi:hypothetical protein